MCKWVAVGGTVLVLLASVAPEVGAQTIGHASIAGFATLSDAQIEAARSLRMAFIGRSVGFNIDSGLNCLAYASPAQAPSSCTSGQTETWTRAHTRPNWVYYGWPGLGLANPVTCTGFSGLWTGYQPCFLSWVTSTWNVASFQFDYLTGITSSDPVANYFTERSSNDDVHDLARWEAQVAPQRTIYWTTSLPRADGSIAGTIQRLHDFNVAMRQRAAATPGLVLIDVADIESHRPDGSACLNASGLPIICETYTTETSGGHLNATGSVRVAKAVWLGMVAVGGGSVVPSPTAPANLRLQQ